VITLKKTYILVAKSEKLKEVWMEKINEQVNKIHSLHAHLKVTRAKFQTQKKGFFFKRVSELPDDLPEDLGGPPKQSPATKRKSFTPTAPAKTASSDEESDEEEKGATTTSPAKPVDASSRLTNWQKRKSTVDLVGEFNLTAKHDPQSLLSSNSATSVSASSQTPEVTDNSRKPQVEAGRAASLVKKFERPVGPPPPRPGARVTKQNSKGNIMSEDGPEFQPPGPSKEDTASKEDPVSLGELKDLLRTAQTAISETSSRKSIVLDETSSPYYMV